MGDNSDRLYRLDGVAHITGIINEEELLGVLPPTNCIDKFTMRCSWMQGTFGEIPDGSDDATIRRYARAYIVMLLGILLFGNKWSDHNLTTSEKGPRVAHWRLRIDLLQTGDVTILSNLNS
ncbi:hypothetical protein Ahy_B07g088795 [Arachis hypogaea]|uniref:Aminotransferase-like plant mobile domain-containing protein n=1 Tax=Arachis hypogaea TaxID=3818 RepID=A0A444YFD9_ARAHY|nr:hypothetical protein Ahy_B07g088795 [Arachis hypogaea]